MRIHDVWIAGGQGVCKNGVCVCTQGYRGSYCEIAPACSGILNSAGNCCPTGIVSVPGVCCTSVSFLPLSCSDMLACSCGNTCILSWHDVHRSRLQNMGLQRSSTCLTEATICNMMQYAFLLLILTRFPSHSMVPLSLALPAVKARSPAPSSTATRPINRLLMSLCGL